MWSGGSSKLHAANKEVTSGRSASNVPTPLLLEALVVVAFGGLSVAAALGAVAFALGAIVMNEVSLIEDASL